MGATDGSHGFGARAYSLDGIRFLAETGFEFAEIDWKDPQVVSAALADLIALQDRYGIVYLGDPSAGGTNVDEDLLDVNQLAIPAFGENGPFQPPHYMKTPKRWNFDVSVFKNFNINEDMRIQVRGGFFNIFNSAYPLVRQGAFSDVDLDLNTVCLAEQDGIPNGSGGTSDGVCDPTEGFVLTDVAQRNFGSIITKRGKRIVELAVKFYF